MVLVFKAGLVAATLAGLAPHPNAHDEAQDAPESKEAVKALSDFEALKNYRPTGRVLRCIGLNRIHKTQILDDKTILFKMRGRKHYVNRMKHACPSLKREERFMYKTSLNQLCSIDIITVLDSFGRAWGSCGLSEFEEFEKKPKPEKAETDK